jgi:hypothetical protein
MVDTRNEVKEVFTKRFWQGVKKTFHDALEGRPPERDAVPTAAVETPRGPSPSEAPPDSEMRKED